MGWLRSISATILWFGVAPAFADVCDGLPEQALFLTTSDSYSDLAFGNPLAGICSEQHRNIPSASLVHWPEQKTLLVQQDRPNQERPRILAWLSAKNVADFLTDSRENTPDFSEAPTSILSATLSLPVLKEKTITVRGRDITVLQVLMPMLPEAAKNWLKDFGSTLEKAAPVLIVDESLPVQRFLSRLKPDLARALVLSKEGTVQAEWISFDQVTTHTAAKNTSIFEALSEPPAFWSDADLKERLDTIKSVSRSVLILSGGRFTLPTHPALLDASELVVAQITPELDHELKKSFDVLNVPQGVFLPFEEASAQGILNVIQEMSAFSPIQTQRTLATKQYREAHEAAFFLPLIPEDPSNIASLKRLRDLAASEGTWSAHKVWVIFNPLLMERS